MVHHNASGMTAVAMPCMAVPAKPWLQPKQVFVFATCLSVTMVIVGHVNVHKITVNVGTSNLNVDYRNCTQAMSPIVFLKTHKCASTTVQNAILRYVKRNNLNIALPIAGNYLGKTTKFHRSMLRGTLWEAANMTYDVFCVHAIWNYAEMNRLMGSTNVIFITILRDPVELFRSLWDYNKRVSSYYRMSLEEFAMLDVKPKPPADGRFRANMWRNQLLFDMGLDPSDFENSTEVTNKINEVADKFDLVMITERFDESMILLKDLLCWDFSDVTYLKLNVHNKATKSVLSKEATKKLKTWLKADYMLYSHFEKLCEKRIEKFGIKRMHEELRILKAANEEVHSKCVDKLVTSNDQMKESFTSRIKDMLGYSLKDDKEGLCKYYDSSGSGFMAELRAAQEERARKIMLSNNGISNNSKSYTNSSYNSFLTNTRLINGAWNNSSLKNNRLNNSFLSSSDSNNISLNIINPNNNKLNSGSPKVNGSDIISLNNNSSNHIGPNHNRPTTTNSYNSSSNNSVPILKMY